MTKKYMVIGRTSGVSSKANAPMLDDGNCIVITSKGGKALTEKSAIDLAGKLNAKHRSGSFIEAQVVNAGEVGL